MADQILINVGNNANDGTGDGIQVAGEKINDNLILYLNTSVDSFEQANSLYSFIEEANYLLDLGVPPAVQFPRRMLRSTQNSF